MAPDISSASWRASCASFWRAALSLAVCCAGDRGQHVLGILAGQRLGFGGLAQALGFLGLDLGLHAQALGLLARARRVAAAGFDQQFAAGAVQAVGLALRRLGARRGFGDLDPAIGDIQGALALACRVPWPVRPRPAAPAAFRRRRTRPVAGRIAARPGAGSAPTPRGGRRPCAGSRGQQQGRSQQLSSSSCRLHAQGALEFADLLRGAAATWHWPRLRCCARAPGRHRPWRAGRAPGASLRSRRLAAAACAWARAVARRTQQFGRVLVRIGLVGAIDRLLRGDEFRGSRDLGAHGRGERGQQGESANGHTQGSAELCEATMHRSAVA